MTQKHVVIEHTGAFDTEIIDNLLKSLKTFLTKGNFSILIRKRIYALSVECLDNILKHSDIPKLNNNLYSENPSYFLLEKNDTTFFFKISNIILNGNIKKVEKKIEQINSLDTNGINELYKNSLQNGEISKKGGAGLGLIVMAKTTKNKILYNFTKINDKFSYFTMNLKIDLNN